MNQKNKLLIVKVAGKVTSKNIESDIGMVYAELGSCNISAPLV